LFEFVDHCSIQLLGKPFGEETILKVAHAYEQSTGWRANKPPLKM